MNSTLPLSSLLRLCPIEKSISVSPLFATHTSRSQIIENPLTLSPLLATHTDIPPVSPVFATHTKTTGVCTNSSRFETQYASFTALLSSRDEKLSSANPLESAFTKRDAYNPFRMRIYKNCRVSLLSLAKDLKCYLNSFPVPLFARSAFCLPPSVFRIPHSDFYFLPSVILPPAFRTPLSAFCLLPFPLLQSFRVFTRFRYPSRTRRLRLRFRRASRPFHRRPLSRTQPHSRPGIDRLRRRSDRWQRRQQRRAPSPRRRKNHSRNSRPRAHPRGSRPHPSRCPLRRRRRHRHQQTRRHDCSRWRRSNLRHARQRAPRPRPVSFAIRRSAASRHRSPLGQGNFRRDSRRQERRRPRQARRSFPPAESKKNLSRSRAGLAQGKKRPHRAGHRPRSHPSHPHGCRTQGLARRRHGQSSRRAHRLGFPRHHRQHHARRSPTAYRPHASDSCALFRAQTSRRWRHALRCRRPIACRKNGTARARPQFSPCCQTRFCAASHRPMDRSASCNTRRASQFPERTFCRCR